ncbi:hypothetical protein PCASD_02062 [Puccinia coronata f. sp. avenae]|uniref:Protein farnesyltransferase/geranylgeranyltransferase type-1 subunit alpha n=1 Tax=Puccinia coronata f. sp. avenae TaxID=200324 RepID=A0A2N5VQ35_9BASI|nr:hypothetical protein PCASD_02062 [Puccinia coronata f. sp. avenae]
MPKLPRLAAPGSFDPPPGPLAALVAAPLEAKKTARAAKVHSGPRDSSSVGDALTVCYSASRWLPVGTSPPVPYLKGLDYQVEARLWNRWVQADEGVSWTRHDRIRPTPGVGGQARSISPGQVRLGTEGKAVTLDRAWVIMHHGGTLRQHSNADVHVAPDPASGKTTKSDDTPAAEAQETSLVDDVELWKDVTPIPQGDAERPMVQIAYEPEYRKAMNLFRGILKKDERSERALKLTTLILQYNPGHYTVWNYRSQTLKHLHQSDPEGQHLQKELAMLNEQMGNMRKSYQAWQHRALMVELLGDCSKEIEFVDQVLKRDAKNYHTWTYRQSLLCQYNRPEMWAGELSCVQALLVEDIRNNSAWNHRFFIVFDTFPLHSPTLTSDELKAIVNREIDFTEQQILKAPNNPSAWNYLRGVLKRGSVPLNTVEDFVVPLTKTVQELDAGNAWPADLNKHSDLPAPAAVEFLADSYAESQANVQQALELYRLLADKLDPIRKGYWQFRSQRTQANPATA